MSERKNFFVTDQAKDPLVESVESLSNMHQNGEPCIQGAKLLRLGLVRDGKLLEERLIPAGTEVTVGRSSTCTLVLPKDTAQSSFLLFGLTEQGYTLRVREDMTGRLASPRGVVNLSVACEQAERVEGVYVLPLTTETRGKIVLGEATNILFQFVTLPSADVSDSTPVSVQGEMGGQVDWTLTILAAFSFLLHFGFVGAMYSDWMDPVVNEEALVQGLIDLAKSIPPPPVEEKPVVVENKEDVVQHKQVKRSSNGGARSAKASGGGGAKSAVSDSRAAALVSQAEAMNMQLLAAFGGSSAVQGALSRSDIPPVDLSGIAASQAGVSNSGGDLRMGVAGGGGPVQMGRGGGGLQAIGGSTSAQGGGSGTTGMGRDVGGPKAEAEFGASSSTAPVTNAEATIARLRAGFKLCYQQGLNVDPGMSGKVTLSARVGPNGEVESVSVVNNTGLSAQVVSCLSRKLKNAQFDPPGGSGSTIQIPVSFVQQGK